MVRVPQVVPTVREVQVVHEVQGDRDLAPVDPRPGRPRVDEPASRLPISEEAPLAIWCEAETWGLDLYLAFQLGFSISRGT